MDPTLEGRLLALRQALAMVAAGRAPAEILSALEATMRDGQEDPGAVETSALAVEGAVAEERRMIAREIRLRMG